LVSSNTANSQDSMTSFRISATRTAFLHANALFDVIESLRRAKQSPGTMVYPSIVGYCLASAATVHLHGIHYVNAGGDVYHHHAGTYLVREMRLLRKIGDQWACAKVQHETLKRLIQAHEECV